jgi:hypothetical protein
VAAGLQGDVGGSRSGFLARGAEREYFRVRLARFRVISLAHRLAVTYNDASDHRVGRGKTSLGQPEGAAHPAGVLRQRRLR